MGAEPLTQEGLVAFADWLLERCIDQASFMRDLLALDSLKVRLHELLLSLSARPWSLGSEASLLHFGALQAATSRAPVTFAVPLASLRFLFPRLWPEAEADSE